MYYLRKNWNLLGFEKSSRKHKKYYAIIENKISKKIQRIHFGDSRYESYRDTTGLNLYSTHGDLKRRAMYRLRHRKDLKKGYISPGYLSYYTLW